MRLANGYLREGILAVEASSGSTAISEANFARMLRLPFVAVVPATTSKEKLALIESFGARCPRTATARSVEPDLPVSLSGCRSGASLHTS